MLTSIDIARRTIKTQLVGKNPKTKTSHEIERYYRETEATVVIQMIEIELNRHLATIINIW